MLLVGKFSFDSAHYIKDSDDLLTKKCADQHGHTYHGEIKLDLKMLKHRFQRDFVDFELVKQAINFVVYEYDHKNISDLYGLHTVEQIAERIKDDFIVYFNCESIHVQLILFETDKWGVEC